MAEGWQGAIIIDDPLKVDDAYSKPARDKANRKLISTVKSRKANPDTPIIVIMQRLAEEDPTGFIKAGKVPGDWEYIEIPALITDEYVEALPEHIRSLVDSGERDVDGRFSYWPYKEPLADLLATEQADRYVFSGQYQQRPTPLGGDIIQSAGFRRYTVLPQLRYRKIFADTAQKTAERNDYSVFECWGFGYDNRIYLLDLVRGKWKAPDLKRHAIDFWNKHAAAGAGDPNAPVLRQMVIEDKASGTGLIQEMQADGGIPVEGIERTKDKLTRVMDVVSQIDAGNVCVPAEAPWVSDFITECESFTADDTHMHDDQIDPMVDAINDMLGGAKDLSVWERLAG
jgi:predicted phage terminase large subunit-like protein